MVVCYNGGMSEHDMTEDKTRLISLLEASEIYGFNRYYLAQLAKKGRLKARKLGNSWITTPNDVEEYIQSRTETGRFRKDIQIDS